VARLGVWIVRLTQDPTSGAAATAQIDQLIQAGYLEVGRESANGPTHVRPKQLTLQMLDGRIGSLGDEAPPGLLAALTAEIDRTTDEDKRSKLIHVRDGLAGVAKGLFLTYLRGVLKPAPTTSPHLNTRRPAPP
jgi:hypothetical protein